VIDFFNTESGMNLTPIFNQYLRYTTIPELEIRKKDKALEIRWKTSEANFEMPIVLEIKGVKNRVNVTNDWKKLDGKTKLISEVHPDKAAFYIKY